MVTALDATLPVRSTEKLDNAAPSLRRLDTNEPGSVSFLNDDTSERLDIIFGNQIITAEGLEVLSYGHVSAIPARAALTETIDAAMQQQALVILPWGFGKWLGKRGHYLTDQTDKLSLSGKAFETCFLGDSGARLSMTQPPPILAKAAQMGMRDLPGSDPMPFTSNYRKLGTRGFSVSLPMDHTQPLACIKKALAQSDAQPQLFGQGETLAGFIYNQSRMQIRKHTPFLRQ